MKRFFSKNASAAAGYAEELVAQQNSDSSHIIMLFYFIGLAAVVAESDSKTNSKEMDCLYSFFPNFLNVKKKVDLLYQDALDADLSTIFFTSKINKMKSVSEIICKDICIKLIELADADSPVNNIEFNLITQIALDFGFERKDVEEWLEKYIIKPDVSDYEILNLDETASLTDISDSYRELVMKFHPDKLFSHDDIHPICTELYKKRYDMISSAYKNLKSLAYAGRV
jgi:hypothetical protein